MSGAVNINSTHQNIDFRNWIVTRTFQHMVHIQLSVEKFFVQAIPQKSDQTSVFVANPILAGLILMNTHI